MVHQDREWLYQKYVVEELSMREIGLLAGKSEATIRHFMNKHGIQRRQGSKKITQRLREKQSQRQKGKPTWNKGLAGNYEKWTKRGKEAPGYKGGVSERGNRGYRKVLMPEHPAADANGYVFEHRLVCEQLLGRYLEDDEIVHHRDGNRLNNDPSNLFIFVGHDTHIAFHQAKRNSPDLTEEEFCRGEDY